MGAREIYRGIIVENIGYAYLIQDSHIGQEQFDKIVKLIVDTVCSAGKTICIVGDGLSGGGGQILVYEAGVCLEEGHRR